MGLSTTTILGYGVDLGSDWEESVMPFMTSLFKDIEEVDSEILEEMLEELPQLWHMSKIGYKLPENYLPPENRHKDASWKAYDKACKKESSNIGISVQIYGHCYGDDARYIIVDSYTMQESEKLTARDIKKAKISKKDQEKMQSFAKDLGVDGVDWQMVDLTC